MSNEYNARMKSILRRVERQGKAKAARNAALSNLNLYLTLLQPEH